MNRLQLRVAMLRQGRTRCYDCHKRLNRKTLHYRPFRYPAGTVELVPVCAAHAPKKKKKEADTNG